MGVETQEIKFIMILESIDDGALIDDQRVAARCLVQLDIRNAGNEGPDRAGGAGGRGEEIFEIIAVIGQFLDVRRGVQRVSRQTRFVRGK